MRWVNLNSFYRVPHKYTYKISLISFLFITHPQFLPRLDTRRTPPNWFPLLLLHMSWLEIDWESNTGDKSTLLLACYLENAKIKWTRGKFPDSLLFSRHSPHFPARKNLMHHKWRQGAGGGNCVWRIFSIGSWAANSSTTQLKHNPNTRLQCPLEQWRSPNSILVFSISTRHTDSE